MKTLCVFLGATLSVTSACAADFMKGVDAMGRRDYTAALAEFTPLAESGNKDAQVKLGTMYQYGHGVAVDEYRAIDWYQKAASQDDPEGEVDLGVMYERGLGTRQDQAKAVEWFRHAADAGWSRAELRLAVAYDRGQGVPQDHGQATEWLKKSLKQGYPPAQAYAGFLALTGQGEPRDLKRALSLFHLAAWRDDPDGSFYLGEMYYKGNGVAKDYVVAYALATAAYNERDNDPDLTEQPEELIRQIAKSMSATQLADSEKLLANARSGLINAIDDRSYALGQASKESFSRDIPPVLVQIGRNGRISLNDEPMKEPDLVARLRMVFYMAPTPQVRIITDGDAAQPGEKGVIEMVIRDIRQIGWQDVVIERH